MATATNFEKERIELATVLASTAFLRAPNLVSLLTYVCQKYFDGQADQLKEYSLAVEALGRPADFDNKKDSVVRVEVHRLRKRLQDYYQNEGASHAIQITIPSGQYAPRFVYNSQLTASNPPGASVHAPPNELSVAKELVAVPAQVHILPPVQATGRLQPRWVAITAVVFVITAGVLAYLRSSSAPTATAANTMAEMLPAGDEIRILAGATQPYQDSDGHRWSADHFYTGGATFNDPQHPIFGTADPNIYRTRREGTFQYDIPLKTGMYELRLYFAETLYGEFNIATGGESTRIFNVKVNGVPRLTDLDVIADAGASTADVRVMKDVAPASDGKLHLQFEGVTNQPFLNAIALSPSQPGRLNSIRIIARDHAYTDKQGRAWEPDRFVRGGQLVKRVISVSSAEDPEIYRGERYGNLTYSIPVAPGRYTVRLHFAETWFGPDKPGHGGVGDRVFDVLGNGVMLIHNLDIFKEAGGGDRELVKVFRNVEPTPQGRIVIQMVPRRNYACVNAIEVIDESK